MIPTAKHFIKTRTGPWEVWDKDRDIEVKVIKKDSNAYIYFQGSGSVKDWLINLSFPIKPYKNMKDGLWFAHGGYVKSYKSIQDRLWKEIEDCEKVFISGYSQGSAYAILAHEDLFFHDKQVETIAYASPRVFFWWGFWQLKKRLKNLTLVHMRGDIVTHLPPIVFGFTHIGDKKKLGKKVFSILPIPKFHLPKYYIDYLEKE